MLRVSLGAKLEIVSLLRISRKASRKRWHWGATGKKALVTHTTCCLLCPTPALVK